MLFRMYITQTDADYLNLNFFHAFESNQAKKGIRKFRIRFTCFMLLLMGVAYWLLEWTIFNVLILALYTILALFLLKPIQKGLFKVQMKQFKKNAKLPFEPVSAFEFYENTFVEIAPTNKNEYDYKAIERVCIVKDRYILLYTNSLNAYQLPISQIKEQVDYDAFIHFLGQKFSTVEYY